MNSSTSSPDIHDSFSHWPVDIKKAGITGIMKRLKLKTFSECEEVLTTFSLYLDLPKEKRGIHISRIVNALLSIESSSCFKPIELEMVLSKKILETHPYSFFSRVEMAYETLYDGKPVSLKFALSANKKGEIDATFALRLIGMTACPCAKAVYKYYERTDELNTPTHMQRADVEILIETKDYEAANALAFEVVINEALKSFSNIPQLSMSRDEEYRFIKNAINKPMFAEDVARATYSFLKKELGERFGIMVKVTSYESIHPFNILAEVGDTE